MSNNLKAAATALNKIEELNEEENQQVKEIEEFEKIAQSINQTATTSQQKWQAVRLNQRELAQEFKKERIRQNLTQRELGILANRAASTVSANEKYIGGVSTMMLIANALGKKLTIN